VRRQLLVAAAGLALVLAAPVAAQPVVKNADEGGTCGRKHGTEVRFVDTPKEAAQKAKNEEKLVFILHVSGNFENPRFT